MPKRFMKQLFYGGGFLMFLAVLLYSWYLFALKPAPSCFDNKRNQGEEEADCGGPCETCAIRRLASIQASSAQMLDPGNGAATALIEFRNVNSTYGARRFTYTLSLFDAQGAELFTVSRQSFVYAGSIKYAMEFDIPVEPDAVRRSEVSVGDVLWERADAFSAPRLELKEMQVQADAAREELVVLGLVANREGVKLSRATVVVVVSNPLGLLVGASREQLRDLEGLADRPFRVVVPGIVEAEDIDERLVEVRLEGER